MRKLCLLAVALLFINAICLAAIRRVGYNGTARPGVDYADFNSAHNASAAGDTIQVYASANGTVSKRVVIIGFGYNFDVNQNLQATGGNSPSPVNLSFELGSENSVIQGCSGGITLITSNITIRRYFGSVTFQNQTRAISNTRLESSVLSSCNMATTAGNPCANTQIYNCILSNVNLYQAGTSGSIINCVTVNPSFQGSTINLNNAGFLVRNCILGNFDAGNTNTIWENNFFSVNQPGTLPAGSNNRWGQTWANLFNRLGGTTDNAGYYADGQFREEYFVLKPGSLAINAGFDGAGNPTDAGIFGGDAVYRYKLSGVPAVPAIYKLSAPSTSATSNPYNITISVRSNN